MKEPVVWEYSITAGSQVFSQQLYRQIQAKY